MQPKKPCPECGGKNIYTSKPTAAAGGYGPDLLPGLGKILSSGLFSVLLCADCGYARYFATKETTERLNNSKKWSKL